MEAEEKARRLGEVANDWWSCQRCPLSEGKTQVLFGDGNVNAQLLIVFAGGSARDDAKGALLQGRDGAMLDSLLEALELDRDDVFLVPLLACPSREFDKTHLAACIGRVHKIIEIVDPYVVLLLGPLATKMLAPSGTKYMKSIKSSRVEPVSVTTPGTFLPVSRSGFISADLFWLADNWSDRLGKLALEPWKAAAKAASYYYRLFEGGKDGA